jgi:hypothetical protein
MAKTRKREPKVERSNGANVGFEQNWAAADKLGGHPPDKQEKPTQTVLEQAQLFGCEMAA